MGGKVNARLPPFLLYPSVQARWLAGVGDAPSDYLDYLRYLCIADGARAREEMDFRPRYTTQEVMESFVGQLRLRRLRLADSPEA